MDIIVLRPDTTEAQLKHIVKKLESRGLQANISKGTERTIIGVIGDTSKVTEEEENTIRIMPGVEDVMRILKPYRMASRDFQSSDSKINVKGIIIGGKKIQVIAGPCAVENRTILMSIGEKVKASRSRFYQGRRFQAPHITIFFSGAGRRRVEISCLCQKKDRPSCCDGTHGPQRHGGNCKICRHYPDRGKEHAELQTAP